MLSSCGLGPEALHEHGNERQQEGELDLAIEYYRRSLELDDSKAIVFVDLAAAYYESGQVVEASLSCERALQIDPGNARASSLLARSYFELGRAQEALPFALRGTQTPAPEAFALWTLGAVFLELKRYEDAERLYLMTLRSLQYPTPSYADGQWRRELSPEDVGYLCFGVGLACKGQGKFREAGLWYDRALDYVPGRSTVLTEKGILLERSGRWREALDCYKRAIKDDPSYTDAQVRAGVALYNLGEILAARDMLVAARDDSSAGPEAPYVLGQIAEQRGFALEAIDFYREARWMDESMAPAWLREGLLLRTLGFHSEGTRCIEMARHQGSSAARWILESEAGKGSSKDLPHP